MLHAFKRDVQTIFFLYKELATPRRRIEDNIKKKSYRNGICVELTHPVPDKDQ
jgi:hypothetical protein